MSPGMREVYDSNPFIAEMGVDCVSRNTDNAEIVDWSVEQSRQLDEPIRALHGGPGKLAISK